MKTTKILPMLASLLMLASLSGCAMLNKGTLHYNRTTTIGQELIDLKKAKDNGTISDAEYTQLKEGIMSSDPLMTKKCAVEL